MSEPQSGACWRLRVRVEIAASHIIEGHPGACARLHGHNWKIDINVIADALDELGMGIDFGDMKRLAREVTDPLDHRHLNDIPPFNRINPTAENVAAYVYGELRNRLAGDRHRIDSVIIWETDRSSVEYREDQTRIG